MGIFHRLRMGSPSVLLLPRILFSLPVPLRLRLSGVLPRLLFAVPYTELLRAELLPSIQSLCPV
jgi:hypothetical protein